MADTTRHEQELKQKAAHSIAKTTDPIEKLRLKCLARGASGIKGIGRYIHVHVYHTLPRERISTVKNRALKLLGYLILPKPAVLLLPFKDFSHYGR
jgi:hypothetical protein